MTMKLTELQTALVSAMKASGIDPDTGASLLTFIQTEDQQWAMLDWMDSEYDKTGKFPDQAACCRAVDAILDKYPTNVA